MDEKNNQSNNPVEVYSEQSVAPEGEPTPVYTGQNGHPILNPDPTSPPPPNKFMSFFSKIPLKAVVIGLVALLVLGVSAALVKTYFFAPKEPLQITLTYWGLWEDTDTVQALISEYESQNPNVKIKYVKQAQVDYQERVSNALNKSDGPDIFRFHNTWVPMLSSKMSILPSNVMDANTFKTVFYPVAARDLQSGGSFVGIPLMFDGLGLYINEDLFTAAQKSPPTTWEDLRKTAKDLTVKDKDERIQQAGVAMGRVDNVDNWEDILSLLMLQNGVNMAKPEGPVAEGSLDFYTQFALTDKVWDDTMPPSTQAFAAGKLAMYLGPSWSAFEIKQQNPNLSFRVVPVPQLPKNTLSDPDINWASYWAEGVSNKSANQEDAWKFLKYLSDKNSMQRLYSNSAKARLFGPIYSRVDMADLVVNDPFIGAYVKEAGTAKSWYLSSRTFDGANGINTQLANVYKAGINAMLVDRKYAKDVLPTIAQGVAKVLGSFGK